MQQERIRSLVNCQAYTNQNVPTHDYKLIQKQFPNLSIRTTTFRAYLPQAICRKTKQQLPYKNK